MFCPKCGKQNPDNSSFCAFCAAKLTDDNSFGENNSTPVYGTRPQNAGFKMETGRGANGSFLKRHGKVVIPVSVAVVAIVAFLIVGSSVFTPEREVERYFKSVVDVDGDLAYSCIDLPQSQFISQESFCKFWEDTLKKQDIYNYDISEKVKTDSDHSYDYLFDSEYEYGSDSSKTTIEHTYLIYYYLRGEGTANTMTVTVVEGNHKKFLLFPDYNVLPNFLIKDYEIIVPKGTTATLNGINLTEPVEDGDFDTYKVDALLNQTYELQLDNALCGQHSQNVLPQSGGQYLCGNMQYTTKTANDVYTLAGSQLKILIDAAIAYTDFPTTIVYDKTSGADEDYQQLKTDICNPEKGTGFFKFEITNMSDSSPKQEMSIDTADYICTINYTYDYGIVLKDSKTGELYTNTGEYTADATLRYHYIDGEWVLYDFNL